MNTTAERVNLHTLTTEQKNTLTKEMYSQSSYFQNHFKKDYFEVGCQSIISDLRESITRLLINKKLINEPVPLEQLHEHLSDEMRAYNFNDGVNKISTHFYETDDQFMTEYHRLIQFLRQNLLKEAFWFQATPTIRLHCPNAINSNHYPRYHSDISYGHPPEEINIWIPLTDLVDAHGFRLLTVEQSKDILAQFDYDFAAFIDAAINDKPFSDSCDAKSAPMDTPLGDVLAFDSRCIHTGEPMISHTRISIDIRLVPLSEYDKMTIEYQGLGRRKILFAPGHCYNNKHSDQLLTVTG